MQKTKKIAIFVLSTLIIAGGAYVFRNSAIFDGLSSSVMNTPFICTESALQSQESLYKKTVARYTRALANQTALERKIDQMISNMSGEVQTQQEALTVLKRQINVYARFIQKYEVCKMEVNLQPTVSIGLMSGEAKVMPSLVNEHQELAAFEITSPEKLNTFLDMIQFQVRITPSANLTIDQWFIINDASAPFMCQSNPSAESADLVTLDCYVLGGVSSIVAGTAKSIYRLGAHIVSVGQQEGSVEISVSGLIFNNGRKDFVNNTTPSIIHYGTLPTVPEDNTVVNSVLY